MPTCIIQKQKGHIVQNSNNFVMKQETLQLWQYKKLFFEATLLPKDNSSEKPSQNGSKKNFFPAIMF